MRNLFTMTNLIVALLVVGSISTVVLVNRLRQPALESSSAHVNQEDGIGAASTDIVSTSYYLTPANGDTQVKVIAKSPYRDFINSKIFTCPAAGCELALSGSCVDTTNKFFFCNLPLKLVSAVILQPTDPTKTIKVDTQANTNVSAYQGISADKAVTQQTVTGLNTKVSDGGLAILGITNFDLEANNQLSVKLKRSNGTQIGSTITTTVPRGGTYYLDVARTIQPSQESNLSAEITSINIKKFVAIQTHNSMRLQAYCPAKLVFSQPGDQTQPDADGNYLTWVTFNGTKYSLQLLNIPTFTAGSERTVYQTTSPQQILNPDIDGNYLTWTSGFLIGGSTLASELRIKNVTDTNDTNSATTQLDIVITDPKKMFGQINQGKIGLIKSASTSTLELKHTVYPNPNFQTALTYSSTHDQRAISANASSVFWVEGNLVKSVNSSNVITTVLTVTDLAPNIAVDNNLLVYIKRNDNSGVFVYDLTSGATTQIRKLVTAISPYVSQIRINQNLIVWAEPTTASSTDYQVYVYQYPFGPLVRATSLTNPAKNANPTVTGKRVFWSDYNDQTGNSDIYGCYLQYAYLTDPVPAEIPPVGPTPTPAPIPTSTPATNQTPVAKDDVLNMGMNLSKTVNVLENDYDIDGQLLPATVAIVTAPQKGTITGINATIGAITYKPNNNITGSDSFRYKVCDNRSACSEANVTVSIGKYRIMGRLRVRFTNGQTDYISGVTVKAVMGSNTYWTETSRIDLSTNTNFEIYVLDAGTYTLTGEWLLVDQNDFYQNEYFSGQGSVNVLTTNTQNNPAQITFFIYDAIIQCSQWCQIHGYTQTQCTANTSSCLKSLDQYSNQSCGTSSCCCTGGSIATVLVNSASSLSCNEVCTARSQRCDSVGTNPEGTNGKHWYLDANNQCAEYATSACDRKMDAMSGSCTDTSTGQSRPARWNYCRCVDEPQLTGNPNGIN